MMNTIFSNSSLSALNGNSTGMSKIKRNRDYLLSSEVAADMNTYIGFEPFHLFEDFPQDHSYDSSGNETTDMDYKPSTPMGVRSLFNKSAGVYTGNYLDDMTKGSSSLRIGLNVPLIDSAAVRQKIRENSACSVRDLVLASQAGLMGQETYDWSDFMYCKHLGKLPNTYMITLRRFPIPIGDYIGTMGYGSADKSESAEQSAKNPVSTGCLVTWLGTPGNDIENIMSYSYKMPFKSQQAQIEEAGVDADASNKTLNKVAAMFDTKYMSQYAQGYGGSNGTAVINSVSNKIFGANIADTGPYSVGAIAGFRDKNKVYGPVDAVKDTYIRSDSGLEFRQSITLQFDYEMRSYNGINQRQAFLDLLANILTVTYSTGQFWGGAVWNRTGMHQNNIFSNLSIFSGKAQTFTQFIDSFATSFSEIKSAVSNSISTNGGILQTIKGWLNNLGGMLIGGMLNNLGRPQKIATNSLLSPAPTGFWHVTIGNPKVPLMSMGNMIITDTKITHYGPFGIDDFPTGIRVTVSLERGKGRDSRDIESLYMGGNARIYSPMGPQVADIYNHAKNYKNSTSSISANYSSMTADNSLITASSEFVTEMTQSLKNSSLLKRVFGTDNAEAYIIQAEEQEYGSQPSTKD